MVCKPIVVLVARSKAMVPEAGMKLLLMVRVPGMLAPATFNVAPPAAVAARLRLPLISVAAPLVRPAIRVCG